MAVTTTLIFDGVDLKVFTVEATADADTGTGLVNHGLEGVPLVMSITPTNQAPAEDSSWALGALTATQFQLDKSVIVGSGSAGEQVRIMLANPNAEQLG